MCLGRTNKELEDTRQKTKTTLAHAALGVQSAVAFATLGRYQSAAVGLTARVAKALVSALQLAALSKGVWASGAVNDGRSAAAGVLTVLRRRC